MSLKSVLFERVFKFMNYIVISKRWWGCFMECFCCGMLRWKLLLKQFLLKGVDLWGKNVILKG